MFLPALSQKLPLLVCGQGCVCVSSCSVAAGHPGSSGRGLDSGRREWVGEGKGMQRPLGSVLCWDTGSAAAATAEKMWVWAVASVYFLSGDQRPHLHGEDLCKLPRVPWRRRHLVKRVVYVRDARADEAPTPPSRARSSSAPAEQPASPLASPSLPQGAGGCCSGRAAGGAWAVSVL